METLDRWTSYLKNLKTFFSAKYNRRLYFYSRPHLLHKPLHQSGVVMVASPCIFVFSSQMNRRVVKFLQQICRV